MSELIGRCIAKARLDLWEKYPGQPLDGGMIRVIVESTLSEAANGDITGRLESLERWRRSFTP